MDHDADALSPINISLWMLSLRYEDALRKGQQHSKGPKLDNSWEHPSSAIVERASMHFSFFSTTLNLHHHIPFECILSSLPPLPYVVKVLLNAHLIFVVTLNLLC
jgi:hypothetical protein